MQYFVKEAAETFTRSQRSKLHMHLCVDLKFYHLVYAISAFSGDTQSGLSSHHPPCPGLVPTPTPPPLMSWHMWKHGSAANWITDVTQPKAKLFLSRFFFSRISSAQTQSHFFFQEIMEWLLLEHIAGRMKKKVTGKSQHSLTKGKSYLTNLIASYAKMVKTLGKEHQWV